MKTLSKAYFLISFWLTVSSILMAESLDAIIQKSLEMKPSLQAIQERIEADKASVELSTQFDNPEVSLTVNDIQLSDPSNRSLEPMQWTAINVKQKLPFFGKRQADLNMALATQRLHVTTLAQARVELVFYIKQVAYKVWELEQRFKVVSGYEKLTQHDIELSKSYATTSSSNHMDIMSAELTLSKLRIQKAQLKGQIMATYARLSYLAAYTIDKLDLVLNIPTSPQRSSYEKQLKANMDLAVKDKELLRQEAVTKRVALNHYPDTSVHLGYFYRQDTEDFVSVGFGMKLPVYGSETYEDEIAKRNLLSKKREFSDLEKDVLAKFEEHFTHMTSAYEIYNIIVAYSLPQVEHMTDIEVSSIATGGNLFKYIEILSKKFALEQDQISAMASFYQAEAFLQRLTGAKK